MRVREEGICERRRRHRLRLVLMLRFCLLFILHIYIYMIASFLSILPVSIFSGNVEWDGNVQLVVGSSGQNLKIW